MKSINAAIAIVFAMTGAASAATTWEGDIFLKTAQCSAPGSGAGDPGDYLHAIFAPKVLNKAKHDLLLIFSFKKLMAMQWVPTQATGLLQGTPAVAVNGVGKAGYSALQFPTNTSTFTVQPANPVNTTKSVSLNFAFTQPDGCIVTMTGILVGPWPN